MVQSPPSTIGISSRSTARATASATWRATLTTRDWLCRLRSARSGAKRTTGRSPRSSTSRPASRSAPGNPAVRSAEGAFSCPGPWAPALDGTPISPNFIVLPLRYLDAHQDVRAISNHPPESLRGGRAPHPPTLDDHLLNGGIEVARIDKPHLSFDRRTASRHRQPRPGVGAPACHAKRVGVIEKVDLAGGGGNEPDADRPLAAVLARADQ